METIIVEVTIAAIDTTADYMLPAHVPTKTLIKELVQLAEQVYPAISFGENSPLLCSMNHSSIIPENLTLAQAGVKDGHHLLLV